MLISFPLALLGPSAAHSPTLPCPTLPCLAVSAPTPPTASCLPHHAPAALLVPPHPRRQIRLWDLGSGECSATFSGHRKEVSALRFSRSGALLASGSKDTDVVVWDVAGEAGLYRLRGHRGQVTDVVFVEGRGGSGRRLVSASKDEHVKVWDLDTQHCCQTVVGHR